MTRTEALREYEKYLKSKNYALSTARNNRWQIRRFLFEIKKSVTRITPLDVRRYLALRSETWSNRSCRSFLSLLRVFYRSVGLQAPVVDLRFRVKPAPIQLTLSKETVAKFLSASSKLDNAVTWKLLREPVALRNRACLELLYGLGLRGWEARHMKVVDLDLRAGTVLIRRAKKGQSRIFPLPPSIVPHIERYLAEGRPKLLRPDVDDHGALLLNFSGKPLHLCAVQKIVNNIGKRIGVKAHPHAFRRSVATHLARNGVSILAIKDFLGHAYLRNTARYVQVDHDDLRKAVSVLEATFADE
jgi:site-specific recombinase XerD